MTSDSHESETHVDLRLEALGKGRGPGLVCKGLCYEAQGMCAVKRVLASVEDCCLGFGCWLVIGAGHPTILGSFSATALHPCCIHRHCMSLVALTHGTEVAGGRLTS